MSRMTAIGLVDWRPGSGWIYAGNGEPVSAEHIQVLGLGGVKGVEAMPPPPAHIKDKLGDKAKRERPWPVDRSVTCYTSRESRGIHIVMPCRFYAGVVTKMIKKGETMLPIETVTVQIGFDRGKGLCVCWDEYYYGLRRPIPGAGEGHKP